MIYVFRYFLLPVLLLFSLAFSQTKLQFDRDEGALRIFFDRIQGPAIGLPMNDPCVTLVKEKLKVKEKLGAYKFMGSEKEVFDEIHWTTTEAKQGTGKIVLRGTVKSRKSESQILLNFEPISNTEIKFHVFAQPDAGNKLTLTLNSSPDEYFFGGGEQFSHFNLKGHKVPFFTEEQGIGRGDKGITALTKLLGASGNEFTTYCPIPYVISTKGRAISIETSAWSEMDFSDPTKISITVRDNKINGTIYLSDTPKKLIEQYTEKTGRFGKLPEWAFGTWMGLQGGSEKVTRIVDEAIEAGNPVSAVWIQDWVGKRQTTIGSRLWWDWQADERVYPEFNSFCKKMNDKGVKVLGYINSFLAVDGKMGREAAESGYVIKHTNGYPLVIKAGGFEAYLVDLWKPDAREWLKEIIKTNLIDAGLSGWMADFGEWYPLQWEKSEYFQIKRHNEYPVEWLKINQEAIEEAGKTNEIVYFSRSGYANAAQYASLFWAGDQMVTWEKNDGLPSAVTALISSGMSGISLNHADIGGYTSVTKVVKYVRSRELLYRWAEMAVFTPVFRTHEGLTPEENAQVYDDPQAVEFFARMGKYHAALKPYFIALNQEASQTGVPMVRALYLEFPKDGRTWDIQTSFMLGSDVLVLPVLEPGKTSMEAYFPEGEWQHIVTGNTLQGAGVHLIETPMGVPNAYVKVGGAWSDRIVKAFDALK